MIKYWLSFLVVIVFLKSSQAQSSVKDSSINATLVGVGAGVYLPAGDMADRFGANLTIHLSCGLKRANNWIYSVEGDYIFGSDIKENDLFKNIETSDGFIIGNDGKFATVRTFERGYAITFNVTKLITTGKPNKNTGFLFRLGTGFIQHKIKIETVGNTVPFLNKEYRKGYDRLSNGLALHQFVGYQYMSNKRAVNFFAGFDFFEGFTQNRREFNFDEMRKDDMKRKDIMLGIKVGWILPLYKQAPNSFYYN
ncbi:MAG: hypothetical protein ABI723_20460 [Bacteroidia bacterium]